MPALVPSCAKPRGRAGIWEGGGNSQPGGEHCGSPTIDGKITPYQVCASMRGPRGLGIDHADLTEHLTLASLRGRLQAGLDLAHAGQGDLEGLHIPSAGGPSFVEAC